MGKVKWYAERIKGYDLEHASLLLDKFLKKCNEDPEIRIDSIEFGDRYILEKPDHKGVIIVVIYTKGRNFVGIHV